MILFQAAVPFLAGVLLAAFGGAGAWPIVALGGVGICIGALLTGKHKEAAMLAAFVLLCLVGIDRYAEAVPPSEPGGIALLNGRDEPATLRGVIVDEPEEGDRTQRFTLRVDAVQQRGAALQEADGRVLIVTRPFPEYEYGDVLEVMATLETPPRLDAFDYHEYLARQGVHSQILFPE